MAKWFGYIGYATDIEVEPGAWGKQIIRRPYFGELVRNTSKFQLSGGVNDNSNIANELSIVADPFAYENFSKMQFVEFMGTEWKITNIEVKYPRLILTIGGVYNGESTTVTK